MLQILVAVGGDGCLFSAIYGFVNPGDEVHSNIPVYSCVMVIWHGIDIGCHNRTLFCLVSICSQNGWRNPQVCSTEVCGEGESTSTQLMEQKIELQHFYRASEMWHHRETLCLIPMNWLQHLAPKQKLLLSIHPITHLERL